MVGDGEWVMNNQRIDRQTYEKLPAFFNPLDYNPKEWVAIAKNAGMKYITITSKHHDGFAMFDSKLTDWDIVDRTPYRKDVIKMLADECRKEGIKLFFYHSQLDWYQDDYYPRGSTGQASGRPDGGDWYSYLDFMDGQLTELLSNYGEIGGIWFDGYWDKKDSDWRLDQTYGLIHRLQPGCLVGSNHHLPPFPGEDFQMFEKDLPGQKTTGFNSNFLLNIGPMPDGKIQPEFISILKEVGEWMKKNGATVYGTRGGPVSPRSWGVTTQKGNKVYVHILNPEDNNILIPDFGKKIRNISTFGSGIRLKYKQDAFGIAVTVPDELIDETDTILVIDI